MSNTLRALFVRDDTSATISPMTAQLLIALLILTLVSLSATATLLFIRAYRKKRLQQSTLPMYNNTNHSSTSSQSKIRHRRLTITAAPYGRASHVFVVDEKQALFDDCNQHQRGSVPEIRITFPDEEGGSKKGGVVTVRVSENGGVGLEPYEEAEGLPAYSGREGGDFQSLDLERMGGLKEKPNEKMWS